MGVPALCILCFAVETDPVLIMSEISLDAVDDLMKNSNFGSRFDKMVKGLPDLERMISRVHAKTCKRKEL